MGVRRWLPYQPVQDQPSPVCPRPAVLSFCAPHFSVSSCQLCDACCIVLCFTSVLTWTPLTLACLPFLSVAASMSVSAAGMLVRVEAAVRLPRAWIWGLSRPVGGGQVEECCHPPAFLVPWLLIIPVISTASAFNNCRVHDRLIDFREMQSP